MIKFKLLFIFVIALVSCQEVNYASKPESLIPEDTMVNILIDLQKIEALISKNTTQYEQREINARDLVFKKYQVDSAQVAQSSNYYAEDFSTNQRIYEKVKAALEAQKKEIDSLYDVEKDSIAKEKIHAKEKKSLPKDSL